MVSNQGVSHGGHSNQGEHASRDSTDLVTEVEKTNGETAKDDGEVEPRKEGSLVGEEDLGLNSSGKSNSLARGGLKQRSRRHCVRSFRRGLGWRSGSERYVHLKLLSDSEETTRRSVFPHTVD